MARCTHYPTKMFSTQWISSYSTSPSSLERSDADDSSSLGEEGRDFWSRYPGMSDRFRQRGAYWYTDSSEGPDSSWNLDYSNSTIGKGNIDFFFADLAAPCTSCSRCFRGFSRVVGLSRAMVGAIGILFWHLNLSIN